MEKAQTMKLTRKIGKITANVLLYLFLAVCLLAVILTISSKRDTDGTITFLGKQMRVVETGSMEKNDATYDWVKQFKIKDIPTGTVVFIETVPEDEAEAAAWYEELRIGDVLTFKYVELTQKTITHRITGKAEDGKGGYIIDLKGDNREATDVSVEQTLYTSEENSPNYVVGKVTGKSYLLGLVISSLKSPWGLVFVIILPSLAIVIFEILKIVKLVTEGKRKQEAEIRERQQNELDELRRRLAELESQSNTATSGESPPTTDDTPPHNGTSGDTP